MGLYEILMGDSADLEQRIIDAIYRGACEHSELVAAIEQIAQYFDSPGVLIGEFDSTAPDEQFTVGVRTIDHAFMRGYREYAEIDPAPARFAALPVGTATTTDRMFSAEFLRADVVLNEFFRPHGVEATLAAPILSAAGRFAMIGLFQGKGARIS